MNIKQVSFSVPIIVTATGYLFMAVMLLLLPFAIGIEIYRGVRRLIISNEQRLIEDRMNKPLL